MLYQIWGGIVRENTTIELSKNFNTTLIMLIFIKTIWLFFSPDKSNQIAEHRQFNSIVSDKKMLFVVST